ncbi:MAG: C10 family peptidase [Bacteroidales bacterium]
MKKYFLLVFITITSCADGVEVIPDMVDNKQDANESVYLVSEKEALKNAESFFETMNPNASRAINERELLSVTKINNEATRSSDVNSEGLYLFNYKDNKGFSVVSADRRDSVSVYIMSEDGNIDISEIDSDSPFSYIFDYVERYQEYKVGENVVSRSGFNPEKDGWVETKTNTVLSSVGPYITTAWNQVSPYDVTKPGYKMGCVPVAMGQIMAYHKHPVAYGNYTYDWDLIRNNDIGCTARNLAVSTLLNHIGVDADADYGTIETGVYKSDAKKSFENFGYITNNYINFHIDKLKQSLNNRRPVYFRGTNNNQQGHAWIADGYSRVLTETRAYDYDGNPVEDTILNIYNWDNEYTYIHFNIGWGGASNGDYAYTNEYTATEPANGQPITYFWVYDVFTFNLNNYDTNDMEMIVDLRPE